MKREQAEQQAHVEIGAIKSLDQDEQRDDQLHDEGQPGHDLKAVARVPQQLFFGVSGELRIAKICH